ncbi:hypothetical protein AHAS_Ahas20G0052000 [Arachis hypogaea]
MESLWRRGLMQNLGTDNPLSVVNSAEVNSPERRNPTVNIVNRSRHGSQAGNEGFDATKDPMGAMLAMQMSGGDVVHGFTCGHWKWTSIGGRRLQQPRIWIRIDRNRCFEAKRRGGRVSMDHLASTAYQRRQRLCGRWKPRD